MHPSLGTSYSVDHSEWPLLSAHLSDSHRFVSIPLGVPISQWAPLCFLSLSCKADLRLVPISSRRIWMRIADSASSRRKLSGPSVEMLQFLLWWCRNPGLGARLPCLPLSVQPMPLGKRMPVEWEVGCVLTLLAVFGFASASLLETFWNLAFQSKLMQILTYLLTRLWRKGSFWCSSLGRSVGRLQVRLPSLSDNVGAESVIDRLYTSKQPLALFVQRLAMWTCAHERNKEADALRRWDESCPIPCGFQEQGSHLLACFLASPLES